MDLNQVKETLEAVGYPVQSDNWSDVIEELGRSYGAQKVGSSIRTLGDASPLYLKSGNVAFMVDNQLDLHRACIEIQSALKARSGTENIVLRPQSKSRYRVDIERALESEISDSHRCKRSLGIVSAEYHIKYDSETRSQIREQTQIIDDLLSDDKKRNDKAVKAFKALLIY